jgi:predicted esterase
MSQTVWTARTWLIWTLVLFLHPSSFIPHPSARAAEPVLDRYALGQRLRGFEHAWEEYPDPAAHKRALPTLKKLVPFFLAGRAADACTVCDQVRCLLRSADPPPPEVRWAESLWVRPSARLIDPADGPLAVELRACYDAKVDAPAGLSARVSIRPAGGKGPGIGVVTPLPKLPTSAELPLRVSGGEPREGDHTLSVEIVAGGQVLATYRQTISVVPHLRERVNRLRAAAKAAAGEQTTDAATLRSLADLVDKLARRESLETDYPAARLLAEADGLAKAVAAKERFYGAQRPGEFWLTLATAAGTAPVRLFVPEAVKAGQPVPVVVALHGLGGSENLYFEGYGAGLTLRLARQRGWILVGTRAGGVLDGAPPAPAVIDELAKLYPVDRRRVYAIGHSMGASHALTLAQQAPGRFTAVAALGGGGSVNKPEAVKGLPVFVGCGAEDFALNTAKGLARALEQAGAGVTFKAYPDIEHIVIVRAALPEVFAFFEAVGKKKGD